MKSKLYYVQHTPEDGPVDSDDLAPVVTQDEDEEWLHRSIPTSLVSPYHQFGDGIWFESGIAH
jgi:hypothetical protein